MKIRDCNMSPELVRYYAKKLGLVYINGNISENDYEKILEYKNTPKESLTTIAKEFGFSRQYVHKLMTKLGVIKKGQSPNLELVREVLNERRNLANK